MPFFGDKIIYQAICSSTNTVAMQLLATSKPQEGTVVITDHQYQGKGQRGNHWISEPYKNLTCSLIVYPYFLSAQQSFMLNMITTLAIHQVIAAYIPVGLTIKWPNDIYYYNKKLSGLLIENIINKGQIKAAVIGIGINVNQKSFALPRASSLAMICKKQFDLSNLLAQILQAIQFQYTQLQGQNIPALKKAYIQRLYGMHEKHTFQAQSQCFQGIIRGVDALGRLCIEKESGYKQYYGFQEITLVAQ